MKKSITTTGIGEQFGDRRAIELIAQAGFDGVDYSCGMVGWDWYKDDIYVNEHPFTDDAKRISYAKELKQIVDMIADYDRKIKVGEMKEGVAIKTIVFNILKARGKNDR